MTSCNFAHLFTVFMPRFAHFCGKQSLNLWILLWLTKDTGPSIDFNQSFDSKNSHEQLLLDEASALFSSPLHFPIFNCVSRQNSDSA